MQMPLEEKWEAAQLMYGRKVKTFARNSFRQIPYHDQCDMEQEMLIVLWECVRAYDPNKGASFNTFFQQCAKNRITSLIRHYSTKSRAAVVTSLSDEAVAAVVEEYLTPLTAEDQALLRMELREIVALHGEGVFDATGRRRLRAAS